jgi:hypothetical protein
MQDAFRVVALLFGGERIVLEDNLLLADAQALQMRTIIAGHYESVWVEPDTAEARASAGVPTPPLR